MQNLKKVLVKLDYNKISSFFKHESDIESPVGIQIFLWDAEELTF